MAVDRGVAERESFLRHIDDTDDMLGVGGDLVVFSAFCREVFLEEPVQIDGSDFQNTRGAECAELGQVGRSIETAT